MELDPCPISVADIYGTPEGGIVSSKEVQSDDCGADDGWLAFEASCYSKSSFLDVALTWDDADARWEESRAALLLRAIMLPTVVNRKKLKIHSLPDIKNIVAYYLLSLPTKSRHFALRLPVGRGYPVLSTWVQFFRPKHGFAP